MTTNMLQIHAWREVRIMLHGLITIYNSAIDISTEIEIHTLHKLPYNCGSVERFSVSIFEREITYLVLKKFNFKLLNFIYSFSRMTDLQQVAWLIRKKWNPQISKNNENNMKIIS